jgi:tetratricopeptide (TPR) repeat protein
MPSWSSPPSPPPRSLHALGVGLLQLLVLALCASAETSAAASSRSLQQLAREGARLAASGTARGHEAAVAKYHAALQPTNGDGGRLLRHAQVATYNLGLSLVALGRHTEARDAFMSTLDALQGAGGKAAAEQVATVHVALAESHARAASWGAAAQHFNAAAELRPADATVRYNTGGALLNLRATQLGAEKEEHREGEPGQDGAAAVTPSARLRARLAAVASDAAVAHEEALALRPRSIKFAGAAAVAHAMAGRPTRAAAHLRRVLAAGGGGADVGPEAEEHGATPELHMYLAVALETTESPALAVPHFAAVLAPMLRRHAGGAGDGGLGPPDREQLLRHATLRLGKLLEQRRPDVAAAVERLPLPQEVRTPLRDEPSTLWDAAVAFGLWRHPAQRPGYVVPGVALPSQPWWDTDEELLGTGTGNGNCGAVPSATGEQQRPQPSVGRQQQQQQQGAVLGRHRALWAAGKLLELEATALAAEFEANHALAQPPALAQRAVAAASMQEDVPDGAGAGVGPEVVVVSDNEDLADTGWWRQCLFVRNGQRVPANWRDRSAWPVARRVFEALLGRAAANATSAATATAEDSSSGGSAVVGAHHSVAHGPTEEPDDTPNGGGPTQSRQDRMQWLRRLAAGVAERLPKGSIGARCR